VKTHKTPAIAWLQINAGAVGITCQKLGEAEVIADAGITDILVTYPIIGEQKARRLGELAQRCRLTVAADSYPALQSVAYAARESRQDIGFLVECDTGGDRLGVQTPAAALAFAKDVVEVPGISFRGLMTYPTGNGTSAFMEEASELLVNHGIPPEVISGGGTPTLFKTHELGGPVNEVRAGEYVLGDRASLSNGAVPESDLAARVIATVVGRPTASRALLDSGSKTLSMDPVEADGVGGFGLILEYPEAIIYGFSEEHAHVDLAKCDTRPRIGDRVTIVPNHVCACVNLHESVALHREGRIEEITPVAARGRIR
jgi:D-serine deaminase-like pyridoxal phosphate-dependent protein